MEKFKHETEKKTGYRQILARREYCKLIVANLINRFGDSVDALAFTWLVYQVTGSASWSAVIYALNMLPTIFLQPIAGVMVERRSKKKLMILADVLRGIVVVVLAVTYLTGVVNPWIMAAFTLTVSSVEAFCIPAGVAIIPKLLDESEYEFGASLNSTASRLMELAGTAAAGIIIGVWGIGAAILIDAGTFFASAWIKLFLRVEETFTEKGEAPGAALYVSDLKEGFSYVRTKDVVLRLCILAFFTNAVLTPLNSLQSPLVMDVLGEGSGLLGVLGAACTVGMGLATVIFPYLSAKCRVRSMICTSGTGLGVCYALITAGSLFPGHAAAVYGITAVSAFGIGLSVALLSCTLSVQFIKCVEEAYLARASALFNAGATAAVPVTSFCVSILVKYSSVKEILIACGIICVIINIRMARKM